MPARVPKPIDQLIENEWDALLFRNKDSVAQMLGWVSYHTLRSRGSKSGYPDRTAYRDRIILVELKTAKNTPSDDQVAWLDGLARAGGEVYLWKATQADYDEAAQVLGRRWTFHPPILGAEGIEPPRLTFGEHTLAPRSAWVPGVGRAELLERAESPIPPPQEVLFP